AGGAWGGADQALAGADNASMGVHLFVTHGHRASAALAQNVEHDEIADGARHAKARSHRMSVLELRRFVQTVIEGADDWRATGGLHAEHSRALRPDPPHLFHFVKG